MIVLIVLLGIICFLLAALGITNVQPFTPNRIVLISRGRLEEANADADIYPGMLLQFQSDGGVQAHGTPGGQASPFMICREAALRGLDITQKIPSGDRVQFIMAAKGDKFLMLLQNGQSVTAKTPLMSAGDGTLMADPGTLLYDITAASTAITNTNTETTFSNGSYTLPANTLQPGDVMHLHGRATVTGQNSTNTHRVRVYFGSTVIADSTAVALAAGSIVEWDLYLTVRTIGSGTSGTFVVSGGIVAGVSGTATPVGTVINSTTFDSTAAQVIKVTSLASAMSTSNTIILDEDDLRLLRSGGMNNLVLADETIDNSGGTGTSGFNSAAFIRVWIN